MTPQIPPVPDLPEGDSLVSQVNLRMESVLFRAPEVIGSAKPARALYTELIISESTYLC